MGITDPKELIKLGFRPELANELAQQNRASAGKRASSRASTARRLGKGAGDQPLEQVTGRGGRRVDHELEEQVVVVDALRLAEIAFCAVPNGGGRSKREAADLKRSGVVPGVPDLLIFTPPPCGGFHSVALEMKRIKPDGTKTYMRPNQREWFNTLTEFGWLCLVGYGAEDAISKLQAAGYPVGAAS